MIQLIQRLIHMYGSKMDGFQRVKTTNLPETVTVKGWTTEDAVAKDVAPWPWICETTRNSFWFWFEFVNFQFFWTYMFLQKLKFPRVIQKSVFFFERKSEVRAATLQAAVAHGKISCWIRFLLVDFRQVSSQNKARNIDADWWPVSRCVFWMAKLCRFNAANGHRCLVLIHCNNFSAWHVSIHRGLGPVSGALWGNPMAAVASLELSGQCWMKQKQLNGNIVVYKCIVSMFLNPSDSADCWMDSEMIELGPSAVCDAFNMPACCVARSVLRACSLVGRWDTYKNHE